MESKILKYGIKNQNSNGHLQKPRTTYNLFKHILTF